MEVHQGVEFVATLRANLEMLSHLAQLGAWRSGRLHSLEVGADSGEELLAVDFLGLGRGNDSQ